MSKWSAKAQCDNTSTCKTHALSLAPQDMNKVLDLIIKFGDSKCVRGFNHPQLALMLAPMSTFDEYRKANKLNR